jgi:hypothetical protein
MLDAMFVHAVDELFVESHLVEGVYGLFIVRFELSCGESVLRSN